MKKILKEARKAEDEENVLAFPVPKPQSKPPGGPDWLRQLPAESRFVAQRKNTQGVFLEGFGIGAILPACILLATEDDYKPGIKWVWVDSANFSDKYKLIQVLPDMKEELENQPEKKE